MQDASGNGVTGTVDGNSEVGAGGIDDDGSLDPAAKYNRSVWDD